ncbi:hypothetical protein L210DRAFT_936931 [Boletus edulis BED1]|uniref:Uncharacterized protein n=1 Tax=Boletus edulis BED1 TaxID=1328754 RepID=A0AAD4C241_BOLED|nr:hypothetical protein L210DRAFT_936931 [Boletus edulis BED1]
MKLVLLLPFPSATSYLGRDFQQPSGEPATIKWITVGGRTSAYVAQVQKPYSPEPQQVSF